MKAKQSVREPREKLQIAITEWMLRLEKLGHLKDFLNRKAGWWVFDCPDAQEVLEESIAQELATLKAQVRKEIEELKREHKPCYGKSACDCPGCIAESVHNQAITDCLSIPSLKGEE